MVGENDKTWAGVNLGPRGARSINCLFLAARLNADYKGGLRVIAVVPRVATEILNFLLVLPVDRQGIQFRVVTESLSEAFRDHRECFEGPRDDEDTSIKNSSNIAYQSTYREIIHLRLIFSGFLMNDVSTRITKIRNNINCNISSITLKHWIIRKTNITYWVIIDFFKMKNIGKKFLNVRKFTWLLFGFFYSFIIIVARFV